MPGYYRAIFTISKPDAPSSQVLADAWQCVQDWATRKYGTPDSHFTRSSACGDLKLCALTHRYADASSRDWRLSVRLATDGSAVNADIELRAADAADADPALAPTAPPPSLVQTLLERFDCSVGPDRLAVNATRINAHEADSFVKNELFNPDRQLPLLVLADFRDGSPVLDTDQAQQELAGLAKVIAYDHNTAWNIMRDLQHELWCYDGAIRLFAPGCSADALEQQHPYWLLRHLERVIRDNRLWQMLRDECLLRTPHQRQSRLLSRVENAINEEESIILAELTDRVLRLQHSQDDIDKLLKFLDKSYIGGDYVRSGLYRAAVTVAKAMKNRADILDGTRPAPKTYDPTSEPPPTPPLPTQPTPKFSTIHACAEYAAQNLPHLRFLPNALVTAQSNYTRQYNTKAAQIYETFEVLNECGRQRTQPGALQGKGVEQWLKENGVEYSDESESTMREYSKERTFFDPDKDEYIPMPHHIKMLHNAIRIHLRWDATEKKFLIGYIGEHLPTSQDRH